MSRYASTLHDPRGASRTNQPSPVAWQERFSTLVPAVALALLLVGCRASLGAAGTAGMGGSSAGSAPREESAANADVGGAGGTDDSSWTLAEREYWTQLQAELDDFARKANDHCHSQITASYVKESYRGRLSAGGNYGMETYLRTVCTAALTSVRDVCLDGESAKAAVAQNIRHVTCALGPTSYALDDGNFAATYDAADPNLATYGNAMVAFLRGHL
jgi:hypothetical protein